eukprot:scaffold4344_cov207-Prasinococcus_capsulatus_cf.AAC.3
MASDGLWRGRPPSVVVARLRRPVADDAEAKKPVQQRWRLAARASCSGRPAALVSGGSRQALATPGSVGVPPCPTDRVPPTKAHAGCGHWRFVCLRELLTSSECILARIGPCVMARHPVRLRLSSRAVPRVVALPVGVPVRSCGREEAAAKSRAGCERPALRTYIAPPACGHKHSRSARTY